MRIDNRFTVPATQERTWEFLTDLGRVAPCLPGATVESVVGDALTGRVALRIGPMNMSYEGEAKFVVKDDANKVATIEAGGRDGSGGGTVKATIRASLAECAEGTQVSLSTDLGLTGRVAQLGQGPVKVLSEKLLGQFAECLATRIDAPADTHGASTSAPSAAHPTEPIDLIESAPVPKSVLAGLGGIAVGLVVALVLRRLHTLGGR